MRVETSLSEVESLNSRGGYFEFESLNSLGEVCVVSGWEFGIAVRGCVSVRW